MVCEDPTIGGYQLIEFRWWGIAVVGMKMGTEEV